LVDRPEPRRGEIWWAVADKRRPVVVVQADFVNRSAINWILAVPLTTTLAWADAPGNVPLSRRQSGLPRKAVANVSQVAPLHRAGFAERVRVLPDDAVARIDAGLRLVMSLDPPTPLAGRADR
jgi:mRNA interferase MazF